MFFFILILIFKSLVPVIKCFESDHPTVSRKLLYFLIISHWDRDLFFYNKNVF